MRILRVNAGRPILMLVAKYLPVATYFAIYVSFPQCCEQKKMKKGLAHNSPLFIIHPVSVDSYIGESFGAGKNGPDFAVVVCYQGSVLLVLSPL
jgi:hypothetical protein